MLTALALTGYQRRHLPAGWLLWKVAKVAKATRASVNQPKEKKRGSSEVEVCAKGRNRTVAVV